MPQTVLKVMMQEFTTLKVEEVLQRISQDDIRIRWLYTILSTTIVSHASYPQSSTT
jgi:hypothetical protein